MLLLAIESSTRRPSVALRSGDDVVERELSGSRRHASDLLPAIDELLTEAGVAPARLDGLLVGTGPGSYTGLRVGIATALGLVRALGCAARGVPAGELLAFSELAPGEACAHLLDARSGELYLSVLRRTEDEVEVLRAPAVVRPEQLGELLPPDLPILGEPGLARAARLDEAAVARLREDARPSAAALARLGGARLAREGGVALEALEPLYLRPFAARVRRR